MEEEILIPYYSQSNDLQEFETIYFDSVERNKVLACGSENTCIIIQDLLDKDIRKLEHEERVQTYGLDYSIHDLLCMIENPWERFKRLI